MVLGAAAAWPPATRWPGPWPDRCWASSSGRRLRVAPFAAAVAGLRRPGGSASAGCRGLADCWRWSGKPGQHAVRLHRGGWLLARHPAATVAPLRCCTGIGIGVGTWLGESLPGGSCSRRRWSSAAGGEFVRCSPPATALSAGAPPGTSPMWLLCSNAGGAGADGVLRLVDDVLGSRRRCRCRSRRPRCR